MQHRNAWIPLAVMFLVFAAAFSVIFWPEASLGAKSAFFATRVGCGIGVGRFMTQRRLSGG